MGLRQKDEGARVADALLRACDGPAGEDARKRGDVCLRIAAADAQRVELQNFAREVFVQSASAVAAGLRDSRADRAPRSSDRR